MTMANWRCGIDPSLKTYIPTDIYGDRKMEIIRKEEEYRKLMTDYSTFDCMAVTELIPLIPTEEINTTTLPMTQVYSKEITEEELLNDENGIHNILDLHPVDNYEIEMECQENLSETTDVEHQHQSLFQTQEVYTGEELLLSNDIELENESILYEVENHVLNQQVPEIGIPNDMEETPETRKQKKRRKQREKRYEFQVIRNLYQRFNPTQVKNILIDMNIRW